MLPKYLFLVLFLASMSWAQTTEPNLLGDITLPPELKGKIDSVDTEELKNKSIEAFKEKCEKNGGSEAFDKAHNAFGVFTQCLSGLVNVSNLDQEVKDAMPNGQVDEVFKRYCHKTPQFKDCFHDMTESMKPCFSDEEQNNMKTVYNVTEQLAEFVCYKEGDRIALFISEGGQECFKSKQIELEECVNSTYGGQLSLTMDKFSAESIPQIAFHEKECKQLNTLQACVVAVLETCEKPTTANIVDSLFKFARKATPCKNFPESVTAKPNSAIGVVATSATIIAALVTTLLV